MKKLRFPFKLGQLLSLSVLFCLTSQNSFALSLHKKAQEGIAVSNKITKTVFSPPVFDSQIISSEFSSWAVTEEYPLSSIKLKEAWDRLDRNSAKNFRKKIVVAVIDTGVDYTHPYIKNNIFIPRSIASSINYGIDFSKNAKNKYQPEDNNGHGTHITGLIKSVIPDVQVLPIKYYNANASDEDNFKSTVNAILYAIEQNVDIINYSSGGPGASLDELRALKKAEEKGILVVTAAGNRSSDIDDTKNAYYPASYGLSNIITVINHDSDGKLGRGSNYGKNKADISAPGTRIRSSVPTGRASYLTGTSQATAFVTGVAALIKSLYPDLTYGEIKKLILSSARPANELKEKCLTGGMLDAAKAIAEAQRLFEMKKLQRKIAQND